MAQTGTAPDPRSTEHAALARQLLDEHGILYEKIQAACELAHEDVPAILSDVLRFLHLVAWHKQRLTPARRVDLAWHEFILCTKAYMEFCERHFGRMIHHYPGGSDEDNHRGFKQTIKLYNLYFGTPRPEFWGISTLYTVTAECGACEAGDTQN